MSLKPDSSRLATSIGSGSGGPQRSTAFGFPLPIWKGRAQGKIHVLVIWNTMGQSPGWWAQTLSDSYHTDFSSSSFQAAPCCCWSQAGWHKQEQASFSALRSIPSGWRLLELGELDAVFFLACKWWLHRLWAPSFCPLHHWLLLSLDVQAWNQALPDVWHTALRMRKGNEQLVTLFPVTSSLWLKRGNSKKLCGLIHRNTYIP